MSALYIHKKTYTEFCHCVIKMGLYSKDFLASYVTHKNLSKSSDIIEILFLTTA